MINVLVVEDSKVTSDYLVHLLQTDPDLHVLGTADSGETALEFLAEHRPDVILLDIHLPGIDGFETTRRIMSTRPVPIVVCTASTHFSEMHTVMRALEAGALSAVVKPRGFSDPGAAADAAVMIQHLKMMSEVTVVRRWGRSRSNSVPASPAVPLFTPPLVIAQRPSIVAIGASTGGPLALQQVFSGLSPSFPLPVVVVQHIAPGFTTGLAEWLSATSGLSVQVAQHGTLALPGHIYIAPDDQHLTVSARGELRTNRDAAFNRLRPSVGVLFRSVAENFGGRSVGILLTGMGADGAEELKLIRDRGGLTIAQDEASSVVFGMPGEAVRLGAAMHVLPPDAIAAWLGRLSAGTKR